MDEIDLLPQGLREQSLSPREIVFPYQQAVEALSVLMRAKWAVLGWEGWVKYPDGRHGHPPAQVIGADVAEKREKHGPITFTVQPRCVRSTMKREQQAWDANPGDAHLGLYFCLTATAPEQESA